MERSADYSGLPSPYPSNFGDSRSEASLSDPSSAQQYTSQPEVRTSGYSTTATPTSEYSGYPASARSGSFPEHLHQRAYHQPGVGGSSMAQTPTSPSMPLQDGRNHQNPQPDHQQIKSDNDVPIDPSIAAPSPTQYAYPPQSPYGQHPQDMAHGYGHQNVYAQPRPDWTGYGQPGAPITPGHHVFPQTPTSGSTRPNQVYSFVPIPGAQQHKRPRRRYEEIERMYKCGWNGCEKAYGTLNHLNAHVTMQSHGQKRIPEEFKEIRKEWKARKKAEDAERKAREEEQQRTAQAQAQNDPQGGHDGQQPPSVQQQQYGGARLPPIGYQPTQYPAPPNVSLPNEYSSNYIATGAYNPTSPYQQSHQQVYGQPNGGQPNH